MSVGIVGAGRVGATAAYALVMRGIGREVVLVDKERARAEAEAADVYHAVPFAHPLVLTAGDYKDLAGRRVIILAAGVNQRPGESRMDLLGRNAAVFREVVPNVLRHAPGAVLVVATNPVDVMTHLAARYAAETGVPSQKIIGSGTMLDTARFRVLLGRKLGLDAQHIHGYVIGEHGASEVLTWSLATAAGMPLDEYCRQRDVSFDARARAEIDGNVRGAADKIIAGKGATHFGIGSALARLVDVILRDQRAVLTVCTPLPRVDGVEGVTVSLPNLVTGEGVLQTLSLPLSDDERALLRESARVVRQATDALD